MRICAVICELNPLHLGHEYIFKEARRISGADKVIALMSGNFVQRAIPAVMDEYARAECALQCGVDCVFELPAVYATGSGERFASGAIGILNTIPQVDTLVMGVETADEQEIRSASELQANEPAEYKDALRKYLDDGLSYARAMTRATAEILEKSKSDCNICELLDKPNNKLAVEYNKALIKSDSKIRFCPIHRSVDKERICSASEIREDISNSQNAKFMPSISYKILERELAAHRVNENAFGALIMHALRSADIETIAGAPDCAEGLEFKIKKEADRNTNYIELLNSIRSGRYTRGRIMRICLHNLLGISRALQYDGYAFARLLGIRKDSEELLGILPDNILVSKRDEARLPKNFLPHYSVDKRASDIYSIISGFNGNCFYRKLLVV